VPVPVIHKDCDSRSCTVLWSGIVGGLSNTGFERLQSQDIHWYIRAALHALNTQQCGSPADDVTGMWLDNNYFD
jgi:hypothetical protein